MLTRFFKFCSSLPTKVEGSVIGLHVSEVANAVMVAWLVTQTVLGFQVQFSLRDRRS